MTIPTITDVENAARRIAKQVFRTPVLTCNGINKIAGAEIFFKCENFQKVGAFKFRGATNAVLSLPKEYFFRGVASHSSGNHAQALALAAKNLGIQATIVMPDNSKKVKRDAVAGYGAKIVDCAPTLQARETMLAKVVDQTGAVFIHPYDNFDVISGQGTAAMELLWEVNDLDIMMSPVGGGGLLSGTCISTKSISPRTLVIAAEPTGADDAYRSLQQGKIVPSVDPKTIADGLLTSLSDMTFEIIRNNVSEIVTVSDEFIIKAMKLIWERMKIIVEPSAAISLGAILERKERGKPQTFSGKRIGIILSGGNVDLDNLPWMKQ